MAAILTPLQLQAGSALLQNTGISIPSVLTTAVDDYTSLPLLANLIATIGNSGALPPSTQTALQTFAGNIGNSCPALADSIVTGTVSLVSSTITDPGMTGIITLTADAYLGNNNVSKFAQIFNTAVGYADTTNIFINSAVNANTYLADTFTSMNSLTTGGLTDVNLATQAMGDDLYNAGYWINLNDLANLGTPLALIQQISQRAGTITPLIGALSDAGINENIILNLSNNDLIVTDDVQKVMYEALKNITGAALEQILQILRVWTTNINSLADLLNPAIMLPNSYASLTTVTADGLRGIYITAEPAPPYRTVDQEAESRVVERPLACAVRQSSTNVSTALPSGNTGTGVFYTVNSNLENTLPLFGISLERLAIITEPGLALANKAFANALLQITNISRMTLPQLSDAFLSAETNTDLPDITAQTQAVPQTDLDYYANTYANGSGDNGTILITDILGTAVGTNMIDSLNNSITVINSLYSAGQLTDLITIYDNMLGNVASDAAILTLIGEAETEIGNIIAANPAETTELNTYFSAISSQITSEVAFQTAAAIDVANVVASQTSTQSFIFSLPSFGVDTKVGGTAQYLEDVADITTAGGQSIVATLREGRSKIGLSGSGVGTAANSVPADPDQIPPQANLIPSIVSESAARANVIY
jgi:hypothetical protein